MSFYLSPPPLFFSKTVFPKTYFVFPIFIGGEIFFLTFVALRGSCCSSQGELSLFSLTLLCMFSVYLLIRQTLSIRDKKGEYFVVFLFSGGEYFVGWSLWSLDCIQMLHFVFYLFSFCHVFDGIFILGAMLFFLVPYMFPVSNFY